MTARAAFKLSDVERGCKGVRAAGLSVARVEFNDNGFAVIVGEPEGKPIVKRNPLDRLHAPPA